MVSITLVEISRDLAHAKVWVTYLGPEAERIQHWACDATPFGKAVRFRRVLRRTGLAPAAGMHRLQAEPTRLYLLPDGPPGPDGPPSPTLISAAGQVRALVMELAEPPSWDVLARVWRGVQSDWEFPAPAIVVALCGAAVAMGWVRDDAR